MEAEYFSLVNKEEQFFVAALSHVPYKRVVAIAKAKTGTTNVAEEKDYLEFARTSRIKRLERAERGRR